MSGGIPLSSGFNVGAGILLELKKIQATLVTRDAIPSVARYEGLEVYVISEKKFYYLKGGVTNSDWIERDGVSLEYFIPPLRDLAISAYDVITSDKIWASLGKLLGEENKDMLFELAGDLETMINLLEEYEEEELE